MAIKVKTTSHLHAVTRIVAPRRKGLQRSSPICCESAEIQILTDTSQPLPGQRHAAPMNGDEGATTGTTTPQNRAEMSLRNTGENLGMDASSALLKDASIEISPKLRMWRQPQSPSSGSLTAFACLETQRCFLLAMQRPLDCDLSCERVSTVAPMYYNSEPMHAISRSTRPNPKGVTTRSLGRTQTAKALLSSYHIFAQDNILSLNLSAIAQDLGWWRELILRIAQLLVELDPTNIAGKAGEHHFLGTGDPRCNLVQKLHEHRAQSRS